MYTATEPETENLFKYKMITMVEIFAFYCKRTRLLEGRTRSDDFTLTHVYEIDVVWTECSSKV